LSRRLKIGMKNGTYALIVGLLYIVLKLAFRLRVRGKRNARRDGQYIAVARHRSYWDAPALAIALGAWNRVHFIARKGLMGGNAVLAGIIRYYSTIIDRENFGRADFRRMLEAIKHERLVGIFPEGTTKHRTDAKAGAIHFAALTDKKLLPVNIEAAGPYPPRYPFGFPRLSVSIGQPVAVAELEADLGPQVSRSERYRVMSERLMERVDNA